MGFVTKEQMKPKLAKSEIIKTHLINQKKFRNSAFVFMHITSVQVPHQKP